MMVKSGLGKKYFEIPRAPSELLLPSATKNCPEIRDIHRECSKQFKLILFSVWAEWAVLGSAKTALKFKYEI